MNAPGSRRARRRMLRNAALLGVGAALAISAASASATTPIGDPFPVSAYGSDGVQGPGFLGTASAFAPRAGRHLVVWSVYSSGDPGIFGRLVGEGGVPAGAPFRISDGSGVLPAVAHGARPNEFLVVWRDTNPGPTGDEIHARRVSADGARVGAELRVSDMGPENDSTFNADSPAVAYDQQRDEYLVAWDGRDGAPLADFESEIYVQRLTSAGLEVGVNDRRISDMGPDGDDTYGADNPTIAWNAARDEYLVAWEGDDDVAPTAGETEIHAQLLSGDGAEIGQNDRRVSAMGPNGNTAFRGVDPAAAYDPALDGYVVAWSGSDQRGSMVQDEFEIFVQRVAGDGTEAGADDQRVSDMGPDGDPDHGAFAPSVAFNERAGEYLVSWYGDDDAPPLVEDEVEVFAQRLSAAGQELDANDVPISAAPPAGDTSARAAFPTVSFDPQRNEYLVAWAENDRLPPVVIFEEEMVARRYQAGTPVAIASAQCKVLAPPAPPSGGDPAAVALSSAQLLINQRISQAAVRRANGIQGWFGHGVEARDLCQASLTAADLYPGSIGGYTGLPQTYGPPDPRPVTVTAAGVGNPSKVTLSVGQLLINQRISQAAVRRLNALKTRLDAGLTGGDVIDGQVGRPQLAAGTSVLFTPLPAAPVAASVTAIAPASPGDPSKVTLSAAQLLINQRISQAAVRRANELVRRLGQGIGAPEIRDGSLSAADLAPGVALSTTP